MSVLGSIYSYSRNLPSSSPSPTRLLFSIVHIYTFVKQRNSSHMIGKIMLDYLTTLPVELIHKILDNVPSLGILSSLCFVNKCIRSISLAYPHFQLNFSCVDTSMETSQFGSVCTQILFDRSNCIFNTLR